MPPAAPVLSEVVPTELPPIRPSGPTRLLVIGYGNSLLGDDGIGPYIAEQVASWKQSEVRTLAVPLLTPELCALLPAVELVVFVDAALEATGHPRLVPLTPAPTSAALGHASTPESLLALARSIFGQSPPAWILSVPAANFSLGQSFSGTARRGADRALCQLRHLRQGLDGRHRRART
jgi:hydrogenase maturation protease